MVGNFQADIMKDKGSYIPPEIVANAIKKCKVLKHKLLLLVLYRSGRRVSEVLNLRVKDVNFDLGMVTFPILKKNQVKDKRLKKKDPPRRLKPLDIESLKALKEWIELKELRENDWIFMFDRLIGEPATRMTRFGAYKIIRKAFENIGITDMGDGKPHPHALRHSFAIQYIKTNSGEMTGQDIINLQHHLEHSHIEMTMNYLQFADDAKTKNHLEKMFRKNHQKDHL
jgi:integrase/recombinase XerD